MALLRLLAAAAVVLTLSLGGAQAAAPSLHIELVPPEKMACAGGWQLGQRVALFDAGGGSSDADGALIESSFDQARQAGRLRRRGLVGGEAARVGEPVWDAGAVLDSARPAASERRIFTAGADGRTLPFSWQALDAGQRAALDPDGDGLGQARLDYLRGERTREGDPFRRRSSVLGAIVRSVPLLVGAATAGAAGPGYAAFALRWRQRQRLVYVGANDGMLHAFDWGDGSEHFAFIPPALLPALHQLSSSSAAPRAWVDGSPGQGEALVGGQWRSVLASGMGMGARGLFALDITDPAAAPALLWQFSDADDGAVGYIDAPPQVIKLRVAAPNGTLAFRYFALVANGVNRADGASDGALFLLALDKAASAPWRLGDNYFRLTAPASPAANALAPPAITLNLDGSAHSAYAGDLQGTMWRFDLPGGGGSGSGGGGRAGTGAALFHARTADGKAQPIAEGARVLYAPGGGYLVAFGTGKRLESADLSADVDSGRFGPQSLYVVRDRDSGPLTAAVGRSVLAQRRLFADSDTADGYRIDGAQFDYNGDGAGVRQGWYLDLPNAQRDGERLAAAPQRSGAALIFSSMAPAADRCRPIMRSYVVDSLSGLARARDAPAEAGWITGRSYAAGEPALPLVLASTAPAVGPGAPTPTGARRVPRSVAIYQLGQGGTPSVSDRIVLGLTAGRLSWREIANWRELHEGAAAPASR